MPKKKTVIEDLGDVLPCKLWELHLHISDLISTYGSEADVEFVEEAPSNLRITKGPDRHGKSISDA